MTKLRPEEVWAKACIERTLPEAKVSQHDDGSENSMYDLDVVYPDGSVAAVEVTRAGDEDYIGLANALDQHVSRWQVSDLSGAWWVKALPSARATDLRKQLPNILRGLESDGIRRLRSDRSSPHPLAVRLGKLGIIEVTQAVTDQAGRVLVTAQTGPQFMGALLPSTGDPLVTWLKEWLADPSRGDNVRKLSASGAAEKHLFVFVPGHIQPPDVAVLLAEANPPLPTIPPELSPGVTHVWVIGTFIDWGNGLRWSADRGWERFEKVEPPASDG